METIAIYWGAFNPPTVWHQKVITQLLTKWYVDKIIFSPDGQRTDKNYGISSQDRNEILHTFASEISQQWYNIEFEDHFLHDTSFTTTMQVEAYFREKLWFSPQHIFGIDTITSLPNWTGNVDKYLEKNSKKFL